MGLHSADELARSPFLGHVFENMVILEMVKRISASPFPYNLYFYRTLKGVEVDLLVESGGKMDAYEIKWTQTPHHSMTSALETISKDYPIRNKAILAPITTPFPVSQGILARPWHSVLLRSQDL